MKPALIGGEDDFIGTANVRLRSFFRFALHSNWVKQNPVISIRTPRVSQPPTLPFSMDEMDKILWACDLYPDNGRYRKGTPARLKALVLLMRVKSRQDQLEAAVRKAW